MTGGTAPDLATMRARARQLVDQLAEGWTKGRPDMMVGVFAPEPVFLETPFSTPISGIDAIRQWASDIPYYQSEATFTVGEVFVAGPWFSAEFKLVFRRRTTGEWVDARGALFAETDGERITELRMYWHRWNGGRETSQP
ncbi:MAG TPA: nuclear transport factor 2 family protein [Gemmatimonadales bacterium]